MCSFDLFITSETYVIKPKHRKELVIIDRISQLTSISNDLNNIPTEIEPQVVHGILGSIQLLSGWYLITVNKREFVGELLTHEVFKITSVILHPVAKSTLHLTDIQIDDEKTYLRMLESALNDPGIYFSPTLNLAHSQRNLSHIMTREKLAENISDSEFLWNGYLISEWRRQLGAALSSCSFAHSLEASEFCLRAIKGFVGILRPQEADISQSTPGRQLCYALISRRSVFRVGTRYYARGLDSEGHAANTVETEQIVFLPPDNVFSFVQLRGSVPLYWSQRPNLRYKPAVLLLGVPQRGKDSDSSEHDKSLLLRDYFNDISTTKQYGRVIAVSLLDHRGLENKLRAEFSTLMTSIQNDNLRFEEFDFHKECRALQWHRLDILIHRLLPYLLDSKQTRLRFNNDAETGHAISPVHEQTGVFRTNCIDSLDRTNVVQSMLARFILEVALQEVSSLPTRQPTLLETQWPGFELAFKAVWADNADTLSLQYSGSLALKTDFTRTGKRTFRGLIMDGVNSMIRYYQNNFADGFRQDSMNLLLGHFRPVNDDGSTKALPSGRSSDRDLRSKFLLVIFAFATSMSTLCLLFPPDSRSEQLSYFLFWGTASVLSAIGIIAYGEDFVDKPRLPME